MLKVLSPSEMKEVRGGAKSSPYCSSGEKLYFCSTSFKGGAISTGSVCASSADTAYAQVLAKYVNEAGLAGDPQCF